MRHRFGPFVIDAAARQLWRDGQEIHLSRKAFDVLRLLLARRPTVMSKDDLFREIWPDTFVTDANLNVVIAEIRRALGDSAQAPRFIRTAHGVGYAFCGEASEVAGKDATVLPPVRAWLTAGERTFLLSPGDNVIGRDPQCDVWLDDAGVSRRHACVRLEGTAAVVSDLQSTNGTFVGSRQVEAPVGIGDGEVIGVGAVQMEFHLATGEQPPTKRIRRG